MRIKCRLGIFVAKTTGKDSNWPLREKNDRSTLPFFGCVRVMTLWFFEGLKNWTIKKISGQYSFRWLIFFCWAIFFEVCDSIVHWLHLYGEDFPEFLSENSTPSVESQFVVMANTLRLVSPQFPYSWQLSSSIIHTKQSTRDFIFIPSSPNYDVHLVQVESSQTTICLVEIAEWEIQSQ